MEHLFYHMMAYYIMAKYNNFKNAFKYLKQAHKLAEEQRNELETSWVLHSEQVWCNKLTPEEKFSWQEHCDDSIHIKFNEAELLEKTVCLYSLPLPIYI